MYRYLREDKKNPCWGCKKRYPGCHSHCEDYISAKTKWDKEKAIIDRKRYEEALFLHKDPARRRLIRHDIERRSK